MRVLAAIAGCALAASAQAAEPDWPSVGAEAARLLSGYIRIDTVNAPGPDGAPSGH
jgi:hypothetical protein